MSKVLIKNSLNYGDEFSFDNWSIVTEEKAAEMLADLTKAFTKKTDVYELYFGSNESVHISSLKQAIGERQILNESTANLISNIMGKEGGMLPPTELCSRIMEQYYEEEEDELDDEEEE